MSKEEKIISLNEFKDNKKVIGPDGNPFTGIFIDYYDYETEEKAYETRYKDGKLHGLCAWWYDNGQKEQEKHYKDGKLNGLCTWWYDSGQKEIESHYQDGKPHGLCTWWDENGQIECESYYKNGIEVEDAWSELDENGHSSSPSKTVELIKYVCVDMLLPFLAGFFFSVYF